MKIFSTILLDAFICCNFSYAQKTEEHAKGENKDSLEAGLHVKTRTIFTNNRNIAKSDSASYRLRTYKMNENATKMPKYDAFKERMKQEPFLIDLLKDIINR